MPQVSKRKSTTPARYGKRAKITPVQKSLIRKFIINESETKSPMRTVSQSLLPNIGRAVNLNFFVPQNSTSIGMTGEKIYLKNIHIRSHIVWNGLLSNGVANYPLHFRMMVIKTKDALTNTEAAITTSQVLRQETGTTGSFFAALGHADLHKVSVLYDKVHTFEARDQGQAALVPDKFMFKDIRLKINKTEIYDGDTSGYFKSGNYYIVCFADSNTLQTPALSVTHSWALNFKDM